MGGDGGIASNASLYIFREKQTNATHGGTNVLNTWTTRTLNETLYSAASDVTRYVVVYCSMKVANAFENGTKRSGSSITVLPGTYEIECYGSFFKTNTSALRLCVHYLHKRREAMSI